MEQPLTVSSTENYEKRPIGNKIIQALGTQMTLPTKWAECVKNLINLTDSPKQTQRLYENVEHFWRHGGVRQRENEIIKK